MNRNINLRLHGLSFAGDVGTKDAPIHLANPVTNKWLDARQWVDGVWSLPAAFVRGSTPSLIVELEVEFFAFPDFTLSAYGAFDSAPGAGSPLLGPFRVQLTSDDLHGRFFTTDPIPFNAPLPDGIGRHTLQLDWYAEQVGSEPRRLFVGHSALTICTTWKPMVARPDWYLVQWTYSDVMEWSCAWAQGATDEAQICRQLMARLPACGLQYGFPAWGAQQILAAGGGMCGGWQELFQHLANCQGVPLAPQTLMLPADDADPWTFLVITNPGLNQQSPSAIVGALGHYTDGDQAKPVTDRRYRFGQYPDGGHSVTMLALPGGKVAIHDPSFQRTAEELKLKMPKVEGERGTYEAGNPFRTAYFDQAIHALARKAETTPVDPLDYGRHVLTADIKDPITLVWNDDPKKKVSTLAGQLDRVLATWFSAADARALKRVLGLDGGRLVPNVRALPRALRRTRAMRPRPDAPIPHTMSPVELVQYLMLKMVEGTPQAKSLAWGKAQTMAVLEPPDPLPSPGADKDELGRLAKSAESARLRALARSVIMGGGGGGRSPGRRRPRAR